MDDVKMDILEKKNYYQVLLVIYKDLLTNKQKEIIEEYLAEDLSLSEIGDNHLISRSAVSDTINKVLKKLDHYEDVLHLALKYHQINDKLDLLKDESNEKIVKEIKELLNYGI